MARYVPKEDVEELEKKMKDYTDKVMGTSNGFVKHAHPNAAMSNHSYRQYRSSFLTLGDMQIPDNYRDIFRWCRYFFKFDPLVGAAVRSLATFPVTDWVLHDTKESDTKEAEDEEEVDPAEKKENSDTYKFYNSLFSDQKIYNHLIEIGYDYFLYGNCVIFAEPGIKVMKRRDEDGNLYDKKEVVWKSLQRLDLTRVRIDRDPKTGEKVYYYDIPTELKRVIQTKKPKEKYDRIPEIFKKAFKKKGLVKLKSEYVYHLQMPSESGDNGLWATPPVLHVMKLLLYSNILRQAQEAIAHEHIIPKRIYYFSETNEYAPGSDFDNVSADFASELKKQLDDPNYQVISPIPIDQIKHGGHGKALMLVPELEQLNETILAGMGTPREFVFGGLSYSGSTTSLRILENQFITYRTTLLDYINDFLIKRLAEKRGEWESIDDDDKLVTVSLSELKMQDDIQQKQLMINLNSQGKLPDETMYEKVLGLDPEKISKQLQTERLRKIDEQLEIQKKQMDAQEELERITAERGQHVPTQDPNSPQVPEPSPGTLANAYDGTEPAEETMLAEEEGQQQQQQDDPSTRNRRALNIAQNMMQMTDQQKSRIIQSLPREDAKLVMMTYNQLMDQQQEDNTESVDGGEGGQVDMRPMPEQLPPRRETGGV